MSQLQQFYEELMSDVMADANSSGGTGRTDAAFKESAFTQLVLGDLEAAGVLESPTACYCANSSARLPYKINAYSLPEDEARLDIVIADFRPGDHVQKLSGTEIDRSFRQALRFLSIAVSDGAAGVDAGHEEHAMLREIHEQKQAFDRVQLILITNAEVVQRKDKERKEQQGAYGIGYEIWDLERLRRFRSSGATHEPVVVDLQGLPGGGIPCVPISDERLGYQTCVAIIPGQVLHDLYDEYGSRLLELNVRSYLQARGKINKEILQTLLLQPHLFLAFNNGITIVAETLTLGESGTLIKAIGGLQIVNGGQTTASVHRARKDSNADLSHVYVQAKITVVPVDQFEMMVPEISRLSNTQNKVSTVDLGANHAFHVGVERVARKTWAPGEQSMWFYERARGAFQTERSRVGTTQAKRAAFDRKFPVAQRIVKEDLARYCNVWDGFPHVVSRGGQKNFERFMNGLKKVDKGWEPTQEEFKTLVGKAILFRGAQHVAKELGIKAFGINIVTYAVALLVERTARRIDLLELWNRHALTPAIIKQLREWLPRVAALLLSSAGDRNPGEWFKSEQCWQQLRDASGEFDIYKPLSGELRTVSEEYSGASDEVQGNVARCVSIDAHTWFKIQLWGSESNELQPWQIGIASTLGGYAAQGWMKKPSEKQARQAVIILEAFQRSQVSD